ncbi:prephenate dehydratase [Emydomyces testavorans]|uniref:prephenate dehydratase n=1 Tax=Emydomyces testavorans TaxID=2070801 RepID=A0AAF0DCZ4_9EURO|nr:prephenate dehydratase [Emydomyces testavorans]
MAFLQSRGCSSASKPQVAFLGPLGSFSHEAAAAAFNSQATLLPQSSFQDAFAALQSNKSDFAVIPLENSSNGAVVQTLDLLADRRELYGDITVCGEYYLPVHHCLLVKKDPSHENSPRPPEDISTDPRYKSITKLYTHPQAWGQCEIFLQKHFKGVERQDVSSTSKAAEIVLHETDHHSAAIANKFAAEYHNLDVLAQNIEDNPENTTRFLILRNRKSERTAACGQRTSADDRPESKTKRKTLISFMIDHNSPGALADALVIFKRYGMNLTTINSRPGGARPWQYIFFVECQGLYDGHGDQTVDKIMVDLRKVTEACRHLGSWNDMVGLSQ